MKLENKQFLFVSLCVCVHACRHAHKGSGFPHHQATLQRQMDVLQFYSILILSTVDSVRSNIKGFILQNCLPSPVNRGGVASPGYHLCFLPTSYRFKVPKIGSLGLIYLEEQLTELREKFNLLVTGLLLKEQQMEVIHRKRV